MGQAIDMIAGEAAYAGLATFKDLNHLNEAVRHYQDIINSMNVRQDVKRNLLAVIEHIKRYSCRFFGVSWQGKRQIAADLNMSDRTIIRVCQRLEAFGFIKQHAMKRSSDMQQTSNAIVIQPLETESVRQEAAKVSDQKNKISLKQNPLLHNTYSAKPVTFYQHFKHFISTKMDIKQSMISRLFGVYKSHSSMMTKYGAYSVEDMEHVGYEALKVAVLSQKTRRIKSLPGFYNGVLDRMLDRLATEQIESAFESERSHHTDKGVIS